MKHHFRLDVVWTGNLGTGTSGYRAYARDHKISALGKVVPIAGSSDPAFRGDGARYSPEELLVGALAACHMLSMLHLCADAGLVVTEYADTPSGTMEVARNGAGHFTEVTLRPRLRLVDPARAPELAALYKRAHELCFIANSVNFPVHVEPADG